MVTLLVVPDILAAAVVAASSVLKTGTSHVTNPTWAVAAGVAVVRAQGTSLRGASYSQGCGCTYPA